MFKFVVRQCLNHCATACPNYMSTRNIPGGKGGRCVGLTTLLPSCADCLNIWEPQPSGTLRACNGIAFPLPFIFYYFLQPKNAQFYHEFIHNNSPTATYFDTFVSSSGSSQPTPC